MSSVTARLAGAAIVIGAVACLAPAAASQRGNEVARHQRSRDFSPVPIKSPASEGGFAPRLAAGHGNAALLGWLEKRGENGHAFRMSRYAKGRWSTATTIAEGDSFFANWADVPGLCAFGERSIAAAWLWKNGAGTYSYEIRMSLSHDEGKTWSAPFRVHDDLAGAEHGFVSLTAEPGGLRAVWLDGYRTAGKEEGEGEMTLRSRRIESGGRLGPEEELDARVCDCCPTAAVVARRGLVVAYRDRGADEKRDISFARREDDRWTAPAALHDDGWIIRACPVNGPALAADGMHVAAAWFTAAEDTGRVRVAFSEDGGLTFGAARRLDVESPIGRVDAQMLERGAALVTWLDGEASRATIYGKVVDAGGSPGPVFVIARTTGGRASGIPRALRVGGDMLYAWTEPGTPPRVRMARGPLPRMPSPAISR